MIKLRARTIPHQHQRYDTCGDYFLDSGELDLRISACSDWRSEAAVLVHELIEYFLTKKARIAIEKIDAWDMDHEDAEEPGDVPDCPYAKQHRFAENIERLLVAELGLTWRQHEEIIADATREFRPQRSGGTNGGVRPGGAGLPALTDRGLPAETRGGEARAGHPQIEDDQPGRHHGNPHATE